MCKHPIDELDTFAKYSSLIDLMEYTLVPSKTNITFSFEIYLAS